MSTKLTLYIDDDLAESAKLYAKNKGLSLSKVVNNFFLLLQDNRPDNNHDTMPLTRSLKGILKDTDKKEYKNYLEAKYL